MLNLILSALCLGTLLSFLIGPVFFVTIETSLVVGLKAAIILNLGVILADITCIFLSYFSNITIIKYLDAHPSIFKLCGIIILIYGLYTMIYTKKVNNNSKIKSSSYLKFFIKGFLLNIVNVGVIIFWLSVVLLVSTIYNNNNYNFILYIMILLFTSFCIDLCKIFLGLKIYHKYNEIYCKYKYNNNGLLNNKIRKIIGIILIIFGTFIFIKSFFHTSLLELKYKRLLF